MKIERIALTVMAASLAMLAGIHSDAQVTREKIGSDIYAASGIYHLYKPGNMAETPAPEGYQAFYISHAGRHGSRYHTSLKDFAVVGGKLSAADSLGLLTLKGKALRSDLDRIYRASVGLDGELTERGAEEHRTIAARMYGRFPSVFKSPSRIYVDATSSTVHRCQVSMLNFTGEIKKLNPNLKVNLRSGDSYQRSMLWKPSWFVKVMHISDNLVDSLSRAWIDGSDFMNSVFTDREAADRIIGREDKFLRAVLIAGSIAPDLSMDDICVPGYFSEDERFAIAKLNSCRIYSSMVNAAESEGKRLCVIEGMLDDVIAKADAAVSRKSDVAADLRFAHDASVMPLCGLIGIEGCSEPWHVEEVWKHWMTSDYTPMASNLQMIFYRKPGSKDILVKFLLNEQERAISALTPVSGPYYSWKDVRKHFLRRLDYARSVLATMPAE